MEKEVKILKALADETRLSIVEFLRSGEKPVHEIVAATIKSQPTVSADLRILREAGIVKFRKGILTENCALKFKKEPEKGERFRCYYSINDDKILEIIETLKEISKKN